MSLVSAPVEEIADRTDYFSATRQLNGFDGHLETNERAGTFFLREDHHPNGFYRFYFLKWAGVLENPAREMTLMANLQSANGCNSECL